MFRFLTFTFLCFFSNYIYAKNFIIIDSINCIGNRHTSKKVILNEIGVSSGDTLYLNQIQETFSRFKLQILSTGLFNDAQLNLRNYRPQDAKAEVEIYVEENWYIFPVPIFELADRNFSVWWEEHNRSLSRVNYGFRISHYNLTGNKDPLKFIMHFGYTKKYHLQYDYPYLTLDNKLGLGFSVFYRENNEIAYATKENKTLFASAPDQRKMLSRLRLGSVLRYRPDPYQFFSISLEYHHNKIDALVAEELNPDYFLNGQTDMRFFYLGFHFEYDKRAFRQYPLAGFLLFGNVTKEGFGIFNENNTLSLSVGLEKHWQIFPRLIISHRNKFKANLLRHKQAFANNTGLGWSSDIVSGYELYVMDGTDYGIAMNSIKWRIFNKNVNIAKWLPRQFEKMNMSLFFRFNIDFAYVNEPTYAQSNHLNNRIIYGYGPCIDLILFNNYIYSFELSRNDIGETGLYFHSSIAF